MSVTHQRGPQGWWKDKLRLIKRDAWANPTISVFVATLLTCLALLIAWLTATYAPESVGRGRGMEGANAEGTISVGTGYFTLAVILTLTLAAGFEPVLARRVDQWWLRRGRQSFFALPAACQMLVKFSAAMLLAGPKMLSFALSLVDIALARGFAIAGGAGWGRWQSRYLHFAIVFLISVTLALVAPTTIGVPAVAFSIVSVIAIVRRWSWIEADRDTFLVERGERFGEESAFRLGFAQDLRDEAMVALGCLLFLIPLALDLLQTVTCSSPNGCAFAVSGDAALSSSALMRFPTWLGYLGAELAKTVPFVDWSEVFNVANGSPLKPRTALGSQATFVLRATLDLLFLAAVLQSVQIATRLREQKRAFKANRLPILEPFAEAQELRRVAAQMQHDLDLAPTDQPAIAQFPSYDAPRLREIIRERIELTRRSNEANAASAIGRDFRLMTASALLERQYPGPATDALFSSVLANDLATDQSWLGRVATHAVSNGSTCADADRGARLQRMVADRGQDPDVRAAAARTLGRSRLTDEQISSFKEILQDKRGTQPVQLRADCAVALAKSGHGDLGTLQALAASFSLTNSRSSNIFNGAAWSPTSIENAIPPLCAAFALAVAIESASNEKISNILSIFDSKLLGREIGTHAHGVTFGEAVKVAAMTSLKPLSVSEALSESRGLAHSQLVALIPGTETFPHEFGMGSPNDDEESYASEKPQRRVRMQHYAIGRYPVTQAEYAPFCALLGKSPGPNQVDSDLPAVRLTWHDATRHCSLLRRITGEDYRLPSEAEWEYACRAGTTTRFHWGNDWDVSRVNSNLSRNGSLTDVRRYPPNNWGVWGMLGNVYEWCADPWHPNYNKAPSEQRTWTEFGDFELRVIRGGSWSSGQQNLRCADRNRVASLHSDGYVGFRLARSL